MTKLFCVLVILLIVSSIHGFNKEKDCKCKVITQTNVADNVTKNIYPWSISFFMRRIDNKPGK